MFQKLQNEVSFNGILVNRLHTSYDIINLLQELASCISLQNENESFVQYFVGATGSSIPVKNFAKWQLYALMEKTISRDVNVSAGDLNLCVLGVPCILVGCEPQWYVYHVAP